ncbi:dTDP-4-amino-4,6-dideoxygalactose transaminase [Halospina denitrificans]|uniref:dTDP-4-amino-4,6-dideoxygalactose transaminase n=1 Tax=Halospina denitrificans TaxID=332522 RepID=A0A4R7JY83_9GAMM|nr:DegT/DnrJ/EryC1/StrS family aminotransferase [Halospina denitrificans]TDT43462.1 dTDP-4-amino-4,6-dideoxygalactose transaminase [Halospina denitrificans]
MIQVTKPFIPDRKTLDKYLDGICERAWLTNNGPLVQELTQRLEDYLGVQNLLLVANGTLALQVAYKALGVEDEAVTTPFTFAATPGSMKWQGITPHFADIDPNTLNLDPSQAEKAITERTQALVPVHVYGNACDHDSFQDIASRYNLPLIYDASHAFGVQYKGESLLSCGDAATLSFHATKLFHTVEGGGIVFKNRDDLERARSMINFGQSPETPNDIASVGINAKMSELHAAMGLATLDSIDQIITQRAALIQEYHHCLKGHVEFPQRRGSENGAYMPILLASEEQASAVDSSLQQAGIRPRHYFSPALHETTTYGNDDACPVASDIADRILCLPLYPELTTHQVKWVCEHVCKNL